MIKRITITIAAAALFAVPAQSASAALSVERPNAQEMDHGVSQATTGNDYGTATPPASETTEPEATESIPTPADQGVSTSPGVVAPVTEPTEPSGPEATDGEGDEEGQEDEGPSCGELADEIDTAVKMGQFAFAIGSILGAFGDVALEFEDVYNGDYAVATREAEERGCYDGGAEALE